MLEMKERTELLQVCWDEEIWICLPYVHGRGLPPLRQACVCLPYVDGRNIPVLGHHKKEICMFIIFVLRRY